MKRVLSKLNNEDWRKYFNNYSPQNRCSLIFKRLLEILPENDFFGHQTFKLPESYCSQIKIFRARPKSKINNLTNIEELGYPNAELCKNVGRVNFEGHPVFYGSHDLHTAIKEAAREDWHKNNYNKYIISEWIINKPKELTGVLFTPLNEANGIIITSFNPERRKRTKLLKKINKYFVSSFLKENDYSISSFLGYKLIYDLNLDMIIYKSIVDGVNEKSLNYAFNPQTIDKNFKVNRIFEVESILFQDTHVLGITGIANQQNKELIWTPIDRDNKEIWDDYNKNFR